MHGDTRAPADKLSPSAFMRQLRPKLYSDTIDRTTCQLDAPTLGYHLETITARNQTHDFEIFCRKLCERTLCPNLKPATGPVRLRVCMKARKRFGETDFAGE